MGSAREHLGTPASRRAAARLTAVVALVAVSLWVVRLTGAPDLADNDQLKPAAYALDVVNHGAWAVQRDFFGAVASKPPFTVWIAAGAAILLGEVNRVALTLPGAIGVVGLAGLATYVAARRLSAWAGVFAGLGVLASVTGEKLIALVRTDGFFALAVALTAYAAFVAWERKRARWWVAAWLLAATATLTKGPLAVVLVGFGLVAVLWERRSAAGRGGDEPTPAGVGSGARRAAIGNVLGAAAFLLIVGGWVALAYRAEGQAFVDKMIGDELVGHATASGKGDPPLANFFKSPAYFVAYYTPLSVFAFLGVVRTIRRPAGERATRRLERFMACMLVLGLLLFSAAPHQRPDLLAPLWLAMAVLGGREVALLFGELKPQTLRGIAAGVAAALLTASVAQRHVLVPAEDETASEVTLAEAARAWPEHPLADRPIVDTTNFGLFRFYAGVHREGVEPAAAVERAIERPGTLIAVGARREALEAVLAERGMGWREVYVIDTPDRRLRFVLWEVERVDTFNAPSDGGAE